MLTKLSSWALLIDGILIGLGAFGHGLAAGEVRAALDQFPVDRDVGTMLYVVWYFVSGCMLVFGVTILWMWVRLRAGDGSLLPVALPIGALYVATGIGGMIYRDGDPFMATFALLGSVLLASAFVLRRPRSTSRSRVPSS